jgi:hypothetical protein
LHPFHAMLRTKVQGRRKSFRTYNKVSSFWHSKFCFECRKDIWNPNNITSPRFRYYGDFFHFKLILWQFKSRKDGQPMPDTNVSKWALYQFFSDAG